MKISIPNIFPTLAYLMFLSIAIVLVVASIATYGEDEIKITILLSAIEILCLVMLILISKRIKIITISESEILAIYPFRFKILKFNLERETNFKVEVFDPPKLGVYQNILISTEDSNVSFSDFEFSNFNYLIDQLPLDKSELWEVRKRVLRFNRVVNFILTPISLLFIVIAISQIGSGVTHPIPKINLIVSTVVFYRLTTRLLIYFKWSSRIKKM